MTTFEHIHQHITGLPMNTLPRATHAPYNHIETAWSRWRSITMPTRIIWLFMSFMLITAVAFALRPENAVSRFWLEMYELQNDWMVLALIVGAAMIYPTWYIWRRVALLVVPCFPVVLLLFLLIDQIRRSTTAPLVHGVMFGFVVIFALVTLYQGVEMQEDKTLIQQQAGEIQQLKSKLAADKAE